MTRKEKVIWLLLCGVCVLCLVVPVKGMFLDGIYSWHIRQPEFWNMIGETAGLALILGAVWLFMDKYRMKTIVTAVVCLTFVWCHVVFLPMVVSGVYLIYLYLMGYTIRTRRIRSQTEMKDGWLWDILLGCGAVIVLFCLMSAAGIGSIGALKAAVAGTGIGTVIFSGPKIVREISQHPIPCFTKPQSLLFVLMSIMVLIQVGRMGISLDFDSLWYGVRSEYILDNGRGIYENMGSVGLVYTYPKGLEVLLLPLSDLASHSYLIFFNIWMAVLSLAVVYRIGRFYMNQTYSMFAAACVSSIPAVMNMSITAKTDSATLLVQLIMVLYFLHYLSRSAKAGVDLPYLSRSAKADVDLPYLSRSAKADVDLPYLSRSAKAGVDLPYLSRSAKADVDLPFQNQNEIQARFFIASLGACFLSWTLKPTAVVFSTSVIGMSVLYLLGTRQLVWKAAAREWLSLLIPAAALAGIWARTLIVVGIPVTSVFSSIFLKFGFQLKYPFSVLPLNGSSMEEGSVWRYLLDILYRMLLNPTGDDMSHVIIAWGTSLLFFLLAVVAATLWMNSRKSGHIGQNDKNLTRYALTVMIPFVVVCLVSLLMLGQIDGNYFMLLDVFLILFGCAAISRINGESLRRGILILMFPILLFNVPVTMVSNWAWSLGYTPVSIVNKGRINHRELQRQEMTSLGSSNIWDILAADRATRVIAVGSHPQVFNFPCNVQSYDDITSSWGNVRLVKTMDAFIEYMAYAETDYIYMQAKAVEEGSRCHELMGYLIEAGILTNVIYENGNLLAQVDLQGDYCPEAAQTYEAYKTTYPVRPQQ